MSDVNEALWIRQQLPSRGFLYGAACPEGYIEIRALTVDEQEILDGSGLKGLARIDKVVALATRLPKDLTHEDLLSTDRVAMLLYQRIVTLGSKLTINWTDEHGEDMTSTIDLVKDLNERTPDDVEDILSEKYSADEVTSAVSHGERVDVSMDRLLPEGPALREPMALWLPEIDLTVRFRFLRYRDVQEVERFANQRRAQKGRRTHRGTKNQVRPEYMYGRVLRIDSVVDESGVEQELDHLQKEQLIREMPYAASVRMQNFLEMLDTGIDTTVLLANSRGDMEVQRVQFDDEFFRPSDL